MAFDVVKVASAFHKDQLVFAIQLKYLKLEV